MMFRLPVDGTPELDAAGLALDILAAGQSGRLNRRLVRDEQIAQSVSGGALPLIGGVSFGTLTGIASDGIDLQKVEDALVEEIEKLAEGGITEDELATVQAQAERDWLEQLATCAGRADEISHHALLFGDPNRINTRIDQVRAVTVEQVQAAAAASGSAADGRAQVTYRRAETEAEGTAGRAGMSQVLTTPPAVGARRGRGSSRSRPPRRPAPGPRSTSSTARASTSPPSGSRSPCR